MSKIKLLIVTVVLITLGAVVHFATNTTTDAGKNFVDFVGSDGLEEITVKKSDEQVTLKLNKDLERWMFSSKDNPEIIADANRIVRLLDNINEAQVLQKVTEKTEHYDRFEVSDAKATIFSTKTNNGKDLVLYLGKTKDYSSQFVRKKGDPAVYLISKNINLNTDMKHWMHRKLKLEKDELLAIDYKTKDRKKLSLNYNPGKDDFELLGTPPPKKQLKKQSNFAKQFTEISFNGVQPKKELKKTKKVAEHKLTLGGKAAVNYTFLETNDKPKKYYLDMGIEKGDTELSPRLSYLASLAKDYSFELSSINSNIFQREQKDFFEDKKEEPKKDGKSPAP